MVNSIEVLAHSCIRIQGDIVAYFDPFMVKEEPHDADIVFLTHDHYDHFSPEDFWKVANPDTLIIAPETIVSNLVENDIDKEMIAPVKPGDKLVIFGIPVEVVRSYNTNKEFHPKENNWVGYIVTFDGTRCYIAGDTDIIPENLVIDCNIALVPVGGTYTMNADEAASLINQIHPEIAIPTHYGAITGTKDDGDEFQQLVDPAITVIKKIRFDN